MDRFYSYESIVSSLNLKIKTYVLIHILQTNVTIILFPGLCLNANNFNQRSTPYIQFSESVPPHTMILTKFKLRSKHLSWIFSGPKLNYIENIWIIWYQTSTETESIYLQHDNTLAQVRRDTKICNVPEFSK